MGMTLRKTYPETATPARALLLGAVTLLVLPGILPAGEVRFDYVERISVDDGLSHSEVWEIHQDRRGFLWFATASGLNRYDGYEFKVYQHLPDDPREKHPIGELPALFLTAKTQDSDVVTGMALGANDYLTKPISRDRLLARVRPHLGLLHVHRGSKTWCKRRCPRSRC